MKAILFGALVFVASIASAMADEASDQATFNRLAGPWLQAFIDCSMSKARELKAATPAAEIPDRAIAACDAEAQRFKHVFERAPYNQNDDVAQTNVDVAVKNIRKLIMEGQ